MLLYLSTVLWSALGADPDCLVACLVDEARSATDEEVVFDVTDAVNTLLVLIDFCPV